MGVLGGHTGRCLWPGRHSTIVAESRYQTKTSKLRKETALWAHSVRYSHDGVRVCGRSVKATGRSHCVCSQEAESSECWSQLAFSC